MALRRERLPHAAVVETRSIDQLLEELARSTAAVVAIEVADNRIESSIAAVAQTARWHPGAVIVALANRKLGGYETVLREVGAAHVVVSPRQAREIVAIASQRLAATGENDFNAEEGSLEQQILARLPWN